MLELHLKALRAHSGDPNLATSVPDDVRMATTHGGSNLDASRLTAVNEWIRGLIVYLEDTTIRACALEARNGLKSTDERVWFDAVRRYVAEDLRCPCGVRSGAHGSLVVSPGALMWVLGHAVSLAYDDDDDGDDDEDGKGDGPSPTAGSEPARYDEVMTRDVMHAGIRVDADIEECLLRCDDVVDEAAQRAFGRVCESLAVHRGSSADITVDDIERCIYRIEAEMMPFLTDKKSGLSLDDEDAIKQAIPLGFTTGDEALDRVARVLRILHIKDLRRLQNIVDDAIAVHQEVTANPRTETGPRKGRRRRNKEDAEELGKR